MGAMMSFFFFTAQFVQSVYHCRCRPGSPSCR